MGRGLRRNRTAGQNFRNCQRITTWCCCRDRVSAVANKSRVNMTLTVQEINHWARVLLEAERSCRPVNPISTQLPSLSEADAYQIASARLKLRNQKVNGYKLGYTNEAIRRKMNICSTNFRCLTN